METISHRELRNSSGAVLHAVQRGESYIVTNHGRPVAKVVPLEQAPSDLPVGRPATKRGGFSALRRHVAEEPVRDALADLRGER
jgi:prevent-host-death family protein